MGQFTRQITGFGVCAGAPDGPTICRLFNQAITGTNPLPRYLSSDHDPLFQFQRWKANLWILDVTEIKTVSYIPISHPFVERQIGTVRREFLDYVPFWNLGDLQRKLNSFQDHYNRSRVHQAIDGATGIRRWPLVDENNLNGVADDTDTHIYGALARPGGLCSEVCGSQRYYLTHSYRDESGDSAIPERVATVDNKIGIAVIDS